MCVLRVVNSEIVATFEYRNALASHLTPEDGMKLRHLFTINLFFAVFFGITGSFFPQSWFFLYGLPRTEAAIWTTHLAGGSILGFATLMWYGRTRASQDSRRAIALALAVQDFIGFFASLVLQLRGIANALGWSNVVGYLVLALGYAYFCFVRPVDS